MGLYQVTQRRGARHSAAAAYLHPARRRPNLVVRTGAHATRLAAEGARITGVVATVGGRAVTVRAEREVLVAAGAVGSPQLLLLSGIGSAADLRALGLPVLVGLPGVGENLQDHLAVAVAWECTRPVSLAGADRLAPLARYLLFRTGPLTSNIAEAGGIVRSGPERAAPDLQLHFAPAYFLEHGFANPPGHGYTIGPTLLYPVSRGRVALRSADPLAPPRIQASYLRADADLRVLVDGVRLARRIGGAAALAPFRGREVWPGPDVRDDGAVADFVRRRVQTLYHPVGTCRMGAGPGAAVDSRLRVLGVDGLRVVDASVMPSIVGGNTNAPTIMIAERAAEPIRQGA